MVRREREGDGEAERREGIQGKVGRAALWEMGGSLTRV